MENYIRCGGCNTGWTGEDVCHCSGCHETFADVDVFDAHRSGYGAHGKCLAPGRIQTIPMKKLTGVWVRRTDKKSPGKATRLPSIKESK